MPELGDESALRVMLTCMNVSSDGFAACRCVGPCVGRCVEHIQHMLLSSCNSGTQEHTRQSTSNHSSEPPRTAYGFCTGLRTKPVLVPYRRLGCLFSSGLRTQAGITPVCPAPPSALKVSSVNTGRTCVGYHPVARLRTARTRYIPRRARCSQPGQIASGFVWSWPEPEPRKNQESGIGE